MNKLDDFHYHEALDRCHVAMSAFENYVAEHQAVQAHPEIEELAEKAISAINAVYQAIGAEAHKRRKVNATAAER